jgi:transposase InsO family protein
VNLNDAVDGILNGNRYLIHDRDSVFTTEFLDMVADVGVKSVKLPPRYPNLNAHAESFVRTAIHNFVAHCHTERNHQGLGNRLIRPKGGHLGSACGPEAPAPGWHTKLLLPRCGLSW